MFSQIYGMNYYNAVLLYSSFHHGISKGFISVNYSTPWGGKRETGTHSSLLSQLQRDKNPHFIGIQLSLSLPPSPRAQLGLGPVGQHSLGLEPLPTTSSLGASCSLQGAGESWIPECGILPGHCSSCCPQHCPGSGCSGATIIIIRSWS